MITNVRSILRITRPKCDREQTEDQKPRMKIAELFLRFWFLTKSLMFFQFLFEHTGFSSINLSHSLFPGNRFPTINLLNCLNTAVISSVDHLFFFFGWRLTCCFFESLVPIKTSYIWFNPRHAFRACSEIVNACKVHTCYHFLSSYCG